jgi:hypothetical protein
MAFGKVRLQTRHLLIHQSVQVASAVSSRSQIASLTSMDPNPNSRLRSSGRLKPSRDQAGC